jgi:nucleoside triphosphate diphosphatase
MAEEPCKRYTVGDLLGVMARLRDKDHGCPWDVAQSFATIAPYTLEEAYEVAEAVAREDFAALKDELGDLLLQVVYHAQMASEEGRFDFADVVDSITQKMVRRHPHVFGNAKRDEFISTRMWGRIKSEERRERGESLTGSRFDDVSIGLPALMRAVKLQKRAAEVGFDWDNAAPVLAKIEEELAELRAAIADAGASGGTKLGEELGDLLFAMANVARHLGVDAEAALRDASAKFVRRFANVEAALANEGRRPEDATLEEMNALWEDVKAAERRKD